MIADLEAKIAKIKARAARKQADPALRFVKAGLKSIDKALSATSDAAIRKSLQDARATLAACLAVGGVAVTSVERAVRRRGNIEGLADSLLTYVIDNPGLRGEQIAAALETDTKTMRPAMQRLIGENKIKSKGQRRGTTYHPA